MRIKTAWEIANDKGLVIDRTGRRFQVRANFPWLNNPSCDKFVLAHPKPQFKEKDS